MQMSPEEEGIKTYPSPPSLLGEGPGVKVAPRSGARGLTTQLDAPADVPLPVFRRVGEERAAVLLRRPSL